MAVANVSDKLKPITGFSNIDFKEATPRGGDIASVNDPTAKYEYGGSNFSRGGMMRNPEKIALRDIHKGWLVDSYIRQGVVKYSEKLVKEGFRILGKNDDAVAYIKTRLDLMTFSTGTPWWQTLMRSIRDYVKYGNAFLVKSRFPAGTQLPGIKKKGMLIAKGKGEKASIGGYFNANVLTMQPMFEGSDPQELTSWRQTSSTKTIDHKAADVLHWTYDKQSGSLWGVSMLLPVLDDVRSLRNVEEMVIQLIFKSLNPLFHHEVPDTTGTGLGQQKDVQRAASEYDIMPVNGYLVTPPGHKISVIGVESKALRAEGYLKFLRQRVYAGLGLSELIMGETESSLGMSDSFAALMHDHVRFCQRELSDYITYDIIWDLLIEGGFNPIFDERDRVFWEFNEVDIDRKIKEETHTSLLWTQNLLTLDEARELLGRGPVVDEAGLYVHKVQTVTSSSSDGSGKSNLVGGANKVSNSVNATTSTSAFLNLLKIKLSSLIVNSASISLPEVMILFDTCVNEARLLYGPISKEIIGQANFRVIKALEGASNDKAHSLSKLHGWLDVALYV